MIPPPALRARSQFRAGGSVRAAFSAAPLGAAMGGSAVLEPGAGDSGFTEDAQSVTSRMRIRSRSVESYGRDWRRLANADQIDRCQIGLPASHECLVLVGVAFEPLFDVQCRVTVPNGMRGRRRAALESELNL